MLQTRLMTSTVPLETERPHTHTQFLGHCLASLGNVPSFPCKCQWSHSLEWVREWPQPEGQMTSQACLEMRPLSKVLKGMEGAGSRQVLHTQSVLNKSVLSLLLSCPSFPSLPSGTSSLCLNFPVLLYLWFPRAHPDLPSLKHPPKSQN